MTSKIFKQILYNQIQYDFITEKSKDIDKNLILYLNEMIPRGIYIIKINNILLNIQKSILIELGIFEFTLVYSINNNLGIELIQSIYEHKFNDIMTNINDDPLINNHLLKQKILNDEINSQQVAFFSPHQLNIERWEKLVENKRIKEYNENNIETTDVYLCNKCGERKCKVSIIQTRSADEPSTTFVVCLVCYNVFKK